MAHLIDKIAVHRLRVPLVTPYRLVFGVVEYFDTIIAEVVDCDGNRGFGEATILTGYTDETIEGSWAAAKQFAEELALAGPENAWRGIQRLSGKFPFTATAFGTALEMLAGSKLLDLPANASIPLVGLLNAKEQDSMRAEFQQLLDDGYHTIKVKVGFDVAKDIRLVKDVQQVVNGRARIRLDANQGFTAEQGIAFVKALDPAGIELFEQPCAAADWDSHLAVRRASPVPMMLDESIYGLADIEKAASLKAATYIKLKLMKLITLDGLAKALERIRDLGMKPVLGNGVACDAGCWMEGCIAARYIDNAGEMNGFMKARSPLLKHGLEFSGGALQLKSGFSPQLDADNIRKHQVDSIVRKPRIVSGIAS